MNRRGADSAGPLEEKAGEGLGTHVLQLLPLLVLLLDALLSVGQQLLLVALLLGELLPLLLQSLLTQASQRQGIETSYATNDRARVPLCNTLTIRSIWFNGVYRRGHYCAVGVIIARRVTRRVT